MALGVLSTVLGPTDKLFLFKFSSYFTDEETESYRGCARNNQTRMTDFRTDQELHE